ncbi:MAG: ATP-binding protein [Caldiserica bacterium]|nr:ATP-binding protein [Caldisericota bacterium]
MLNAPTVEKLRQMKLYGMVEALGEQEENSEYKNLGFEERLGFLVDREYELRQQKRLQRRLQQARLKQKAQVENLQFSPERGLDRKQVLYLSEGQWIKQHHNIIITGPTGVGKTYLACALCDALIRKGHSGRYYQMSKLLRGLRVSQVEGTVEKYLKGLIKVDILVVDDFLLEETGVKETRYLLEVVDDRAEAGGMIFCSQIPVSGWHERMEDGRWYFSRCNT